MNIKKLIGNNAHFTINKALMKEIGLHETLLLQHFIDLQENIFGGKFYQQQQRIADELGMSVKTIQRIIKKLHSLGYIFVKKEGTPAKNYYLVNTPKITSIFQLGQIDRTSQDKLTEQVRTKWDDKEKKQIKKKKEENKKDSNSSSIEVEGEKLLENTDDLSTLIKNENLTAEQKNRKSMKMAEDLFDEYWGKI